MTISDLIPNLTEAVETFVHAYRKRYYRASTKGVRADAPMREEVAALNSALIAEVERLREECARSQPVTAHASDEAATSGAERSAIEDHPDTITPGEWDGDEGREGRREDEE